MYPFACGKQLFRLQSRSHEEDCDRSHNRYRRNLGHEDWRDMERKATALPWKDAVGRTHLAFHAQTQNRPPLTGDRVLLDLLTTLLPRLRALRNLPPSSIRKSPEISVKMLQTTKGPVNRLGASPCLFDAR